ncbi:MAG: type III-A CRISPR-associated RAMP protein Csm4 [Desulfoplanes sp.]
MKYYKMRFHSALHVDSKGSGKPESIDEFIRSDTLSAALCLSHKALYPETKQDFFLNPPFQVSSAFPFIGDLLLFPCPVWRIWDNMDIKNRKKVKKIKWISQKILERVLQGKDVDIDGMRLLECGIAITKDEELILPEALPGPAWAITERQRVTVDRLGLKDGGDTFFFGLQFFDPFSGLYFLAQEPDDTPGFLENALTFLGDSGIGADRNCGLGHFKIAGAGTCNLNIPTKAEGSFTISLFNPGQKDNLKTLTSACAYSLETRSGWIHNSTVGRPPIRVFSEGAYFSGHPVGHVVEMLPKDTRQRYQLPISHSAPRDFRVFSLPCKKPSKVNSAEVHHE